MKFNMMRNRVEVSAKENTKRISPELNWKSLVSNHFAILSKDAARILHSEIS
jgi:hypothetical protein